MKPNMISKHSAAKTKAIKDFSAHVSSGKASFFKKYGMDLVLGPRKGPYLQDFDRTKRLFNLHCNGGVFNLGHRNIELIELLKTDNMASIIRCLAKYETFPPAIEQTYEKLLQHKELLLATTK